MRRRIEQIFQRYAALHLDLAKPGFALTDEAGHVIGYIERQRLVGNRLIVEGWSRADRVGVSLGDAREDIVPGLVRPDVVTAYGESAVKTPGFVLDLPFSVGRATVSVSFNDIRYIFALDGFDAAAVRAGQRRLMLPFARALIRATPSVLRWYLFRNQADRTAVKTILGLNVQQAGSGKMDQTLFAPWEFVAAEKAGPDEAAQAQGPQTEEAESERPVLARVAAGPEDTRISIVLPIYNAFELLPDVLDRVLRHTDLDWRLVLIEDCSSDARVRPFLHQWIAALPPEQAAEVTLIENRANLGFIRSVNAAFKVVSRYDDPVVLLNSDAFVPAGWASRLVRPLFTHDNVATVTPMSNDAEIFSTPAICQSTGLAPGVADAMDAVAARFHPDVALAEAPTGVGFCMAIQMRYLREEPEFDTGFGRGYGEEVDWCQRVRLRGGRHLGTAALFVEHRGGASFGSDEKRKLVQANNAVISRRYPEYDREVQDFIGHDPLATARLALGIAWASLQKTGLADGAAGEPAGVPIYLAHSMGGGAEDYLRHRIQNDIQNDIAGSREQDTGTDTSLDTGGRAIVLRVGGHARWQLELHSAYGITRGLTDDFSLVEALLEPLHARHIVYSCGVGDRDPAELPDLLVRLKRNAQDRIEVLFHDFFPVSPSYTLLAADGRYHGLPDPAGPEGDKAHIIRRADGSRCSLREWQAHWGQLMTAADQVTVFSENSRDLVAAAYPVAAKVIKVQPHRLPYAMPKVVLGKKGRGGKPVIGVLGNIGHQKGAEFLATLSTHLAASGAADLVVIGNVDPTYPLQKPARIHGSYEVRDVPDLVARYGIDCWLIPSIWPETFSYVTHEALATGLPVWSFDLGAQGQTVAKAAAERGQGGVIGLHNGQVDPQELLDLILSTSAQEIA